MKSTGIKKIVAYTILLVNVGLSLCVFLEISVPFIFSAPSLYSLMVLIFLAAFSYLANYSVKENVFNVLLYVYFFVVLLVYGKTFVFDQQVGWFDLHGGIYFGSVFGLAIGILWSIYMRILQKEISLWLLTIALPFIVYVVDWSLLGNTVFPLSRQSSKWIAVGIALSIAWTWVCTRDFDVFPISSTYPIAEKVIFVALLGASPIILGPLMNWTAIFFQIPTFSSWSSSLEFLAKHPEGELWMTAMGFRIVSMFLHSIVILLLVLKVQTYWGWPFSLVWILPVPLALWPFWQIEEIGAILFLCAVGLFTHYLFKWGSNRKHQWGKGQEIANC